MAGIVPALGFLAPIVQDIFNWRLVREANRRQEERADYAIRELLGEPEQYKAPEWEDIYRPPDFGELQGVVNRQIQRGRVDAEMLGHEIGQYFSDAGTEDFEKAGLADIAAGSDARSRARIEQAVASAMSRGRGLDQIGDMLDAMQYQEDVARGGQALGIKAAAEQLRNQTKLARAGAQAQARVAGAGLNADLASTGAGLAANIGLSEADSALRAALGEAALGQQSADRMVNLDLSKAGIYTGTPYALFQASGLDRGVSNILQWQAINKPPKTSSGGGGGILGLSVSAQHGCVDGDSMVFTPLGGKPLELVSPRDKLLGADGNYHAVIAKEYGTVPEQERVPHLRLWAGRAQITLTEDHEIQGKAAKDWRVGDMIEVNGELLKVTCIERASYRVSGDLCLEGNVPYIANGFQINSVIGKRIDEYRKLLKRKNGNDAVDDDNYIHDEKNYLGGWVKAEGGA